MNTVSKQLLHSEKKLCDKAAAVMSAEWWDKFMSLTKSHIMDTHTMTPGIQQGIQVLEEAMKDMPKAEVPPHESDSGHLHHDLSVTRPGDKPPEKPKGK
jgi:hypothetical protein